MRENKGITLIALVVTIIVLIILASISIGALTGKNGIIGQSKDAKEQTEIAEEKEVVSLATVKSMEKDRFGNVIRENLQEALDELAGEGKTIVTGNGRFTVTFKESERNYIINENGNVIEATNSNIFTYTEEGYITGIKEEYWYWEEKNTEAQKQNSIKVATIINFKLASVQVPNFRILKDEIGTTLVIPNEINGIKIKGIASNAFAAIKNLKEIIFSEGIQEIGNDVCYFCENLEYVSMPNGITKIGESAFEFCNIKSVNIPDTTIEIGAYCFAHSEIVDKLFIPKSVQKVGENAFSGISLDCKIYCEVDEKPEGWDSLWNGRIVGRPLDVVWGASR